MFYTEDGIPVPAVTAEQMREVDRVAVETFGLGILQMMENAGRTLAVHALDMAPPGGTVVVVAGGGGNGGGGLACARHLLNRGVPVQVILDCPTAALRGPAAHQWQPLAAAGLSPYPLEEAVSVIGAASLIVDALVGYGLRSAPRPRVAYLIEAMNRAPAAVLSLDVPSGVDATTGLAPGAAVQPERILTLALPKTGLAQMDARVYLADIGIPPAVYARVGIDYTPPFGRRWWVGLGVA